MERENMITSHMSFKPDMTLYFDELSTLRLLDSDVKQSSNVLRDACRDFVGRKRLSLLTYRNAGISVSSTVL
jgi:hypothetical protein